MTKGRKPRAIIHMGADTFTIAFPNGDIHNLNKLDKATFNKSVRMMANAYSKGKNYAHHAHAN